MRTPGLLIVALALGGCHATPPADVTGPFSGPTRRFAVDTLIVPRDSHQLATSLDGRADRNAFGDVVDAMQILDLLTVNPSASWVLQLTGAAPQLRMDQQSELGVTLGAGDAPVTVGARRLEGQISSNRTQLTHEPASATVILSLFTGAPPTAVPLQGIELDLTEDGSGWFGELHGAIAADRVLQPFYDGLIASLSAAPARYADISRALDSDRDGQVSFDEFRASSVVQNLFRPDVALHDASGAWAPSADNKPDAISFGVGMHLSPAR